MAPPGHNATLSDVALRVKKALESLLVEKGLTRAPASGGRPDDRQTQ
jgi:hypothetical protein